MRFCLLQHNALLFKPHFTEIDYDLTKEAPHFLAASKIELKHNLLCWSSQATSHTNPVTSCIQPLVVSEGWLVSHDTHYGSPIPGSDCSLHQQILDMAQTLYNKSNIPGIWMNLPQDSCADKKTAQLKWSIYMSVTAHHRQSEDQLTAHVRNKRKFTSCWKKNKKQLITVVSSYRKMSLFVAVKKPKRFWKALFFVYCLPLWVWD